MVPVVLSCRRLLRLDPVDMLSAQVTAAGRGIPAYLLAEAGGPDDKAEDDAERMVAIPAMDEASVALDPPRRAALWAYRERHTEAISPAGPVSGRERKYRG
jgi:hypothetical protein